MTPEEKSRRKPLLAKIQVEIKTTKEKKVYDEFLKAKEYFPQGIKEAIFRAMKLYITDV